MKKKNIILIGIVFVVVIVCILAAVIGFGLNDEKEDDDKDTVRLTQSASDDTKADKTEDETTKEDESENTDDEETTDSEGNESESNEADDEETGDEETSDEETSDEDASDEDASDEEATTKKVTTDDITTEATTSEKSTEADTDEATTEETTTGGDLTQEETTAAIVDKELDRLSYEYMMIDGKSVYSEYSVKITELYNSINEERARAGAPKLVFDTDVSYIACARASQLAFEKTVESSSKVKYYDLMSKSGIQFSKAVENTAAGHSSSSQVVSGDDTSWKTSTRHYDNMISDEYTRVGVGVDYSEVMGYVWVAIFLN